MARALWPEKSADFLSRLKSGENLTKENPILSVRNWLLQMTTRVDTSTIRQVLFHHLCAFVDGKTCASLVSNSNIAYMRVLKLSKVRTDKICKIYNEITLDCSTKNEEEEIKPENLYPLGKAAAKIAETLGQTFSTTDLFARAGDEAGKWLLLWRNHGWIDPAGLNQYRKTEKFGQTVAK
jgi:hypothetical protein